MNQEKAQDKAQSNMEQENKLDKLLQYLQEMDEKIEDLKITVKNDLLTIDQRMEERLMANERTNDERMGKIEERIIEIASRRSSRASSPPRNGEVERQSSVNETIEKFNAEGVKALAGRRGESIGYDGFLPPSFYEEERETRREETKKRDSIMGGLLRFEEETTNEGKLYVASKDYLNIVWKERSLDGYMSFIEEVLEFQWSQGQKIISIFGRIDKSLKDFISDILREYLPHKYSAAEDVYKAPISDIEEAAQILLIPQDLDHFNRVLSASLKKYKVEQVGIGYQQTRANLYRLKTKFKERYNFLTSGAKVLRREEIIPALNFKPGGLLNVWMDFTPMGARSSFTNRLIQGNYPDLDSFFKSFFKIVEENSVMSQHAMTYRMRMNQGEVNEEGPRRDHRQHRDSYQRYGEDQQTGKREMQSRVTGETSWGRSRKSLQMIDDDYDDYGNSGSDEEDALAVVDVNQRRYGQQRGQQPVRPEICRRYLLTRVKPASTSTAGLKCKRRGSS